MRPAREDLRLIEIRRKLARLETSDAFNQPLRRDALITLERIMTKRVAERQVNGRLDTRTRPEGPVRRDPECLRS